MAYYCPPLQCSVAATEVQGYDAVASREDLNEETALDIAGEVQVCVILPLS